MILFSFKELWQDIVVWGLSMYDKFPWWREAINFIINLWDNYRLYVCIGFGVVGALLLILIISRIATRKRR